MAPEIGDDRTIINPVITKLMYDELQTRRNNQILTVNSTRVNERRILTNTYDHRQLKPGKFQY